MAVGVVAGALVSGCVGSESSSPSEERSALDRLRSESTDPARRELVEWLAEETAVRPVDESPLRVEPYPADADVGSVTAQAPSDAVTELLDARGAATEELAGLWWPFEGRYQAAGTAEREAMLVAFVREYEPALRRLRRAVTEADSRLAAAGVQNGR